LAAAALLDREGAVDALARLEPLDALVDRVLHLVGIERLARARSLRRGRERSDDDERRDGETVSHFPAPILTVLRAQAVPQRLEEPTLDRVACAGRGRVSVPLQFRESVPPFSERWREATRRDDRARLPRPRPEEARRRGAAALVELEDDRDLSPRLERDLGLDLGLALI